jgi:hypothetical protein
MKETVGLTFDNMCQDDDDTAIAAGLALQCELWDYDMINKNQCLGSTEILLRDLLDLGKDDHVTKKMFTCGLYLEGDSGTHFCNSVLYSASIW